MLLFSLDLSFKPPFMDEFYFDFFIYGISGLLFIDILLKFKTSFYEHGVLVRSSKKIARNYLKTNFVNDFISVSVMVLYITILKHTYFNWLILIFVIEFRNIKSIIKNFENIINAGDFYELFAIMLKMVCVAHIYACIWHYISFQQNQENEDSWIISMNLINSSWYQRYLYSFYWALTTMVTVGYGDITPKNSYETIFCSFAILTGTLVFGYSFNRIGTLLTNQDERDQELRFFVSIS